MTLETTIVGCGAVAQRLYRKPLQRLEKQGLLRVAALVDPAPDHAAVLSGLFPNAKSCRSIDEAFDRTSSTLTLILSPAHLHCDQTVTALERGSHVLCEKPMAVTEVEAARMNAVAASTQRILAIGMIRRFFPAYAHFRSIVQDGRLGLLHSFEYREGHKFEWEVTTPAAFRRRSAGGTGVMFDIGPHAVDYLAWTFGDLQPLAYADDTLAGIESNAAIAVASPRCAGSIDLSWDGPQANELRVFGTKGDAVLRLDRFAQLAVRSAGAATFTPHPVDIAFAADASPSARRFLTPTSYPEAVYCQIVQVVRAIELGEPPAVDGQAGRRCISFLESSLAKAVALDAPWLDSAQRAAARELHGALVS